jgi:hypothetical protein
MMPQRDRDPRVQGRSLRALTRHSFLIEAVECLFDARSSPWAYLNQLRKQLVGQSMRCPTVI